MVWGGATLDAIARLKQLQKSLGSRRSAILVDGQFDLFEAILEPGAVYELQWPSAPEGVPPVIHPTTGVVPRDAYR
ncbi:hypothetical protein [Nannocystis pusilla]|uniref:Uncharacterized protein n=1 Tax=Nannocystis pusilla TaxID=889268 RepID=A0ABS7TUE0_9BACT|nr:hypothetical protein [Nannocystis pusilla]MBZ5711752.1 hypothetical protein [Nannocystis pusilla]